MLPVTLVGPHGLAQSRNLCTCYLLCAVRKSSRCYVPVDRSSKDPLINEYTFGQPRGLNVVLFVGNIVKSLRRKQGIAKKELHSSLGEDIE